GLCGIQRRRGPPPPRVGGRAVGAFMSHAPTRWWYQAMLVGLSLLALARPAAGQEDQAPPVAPPSPPPREGPTGHPLASPSAVRARALVRVSVQGGVVRPGYYAVPADALVADALMAAGGTLPTSKPGKMRLERGGHRLLDGKEVAQAVAQGRTFDDLNVQDGDQLVVPKEGAGMGDNLRFLWVLVSITGGIVGLTKVFGR